MNRRDFLSTAALTTAATALPAQLANAGGHAAPVPIVQTYTIGQTRVTAISDGFLGIDAGTMVGVEPADFQAALTRAHISGEVHPTGVNAYLVETGETKTLIDTGTGNAFGPGLGQLTGHLQAIGIDPADINTVIATHLHPDHIGGAFVDGANPFSGAELIASVDDMNFWTSPDIKAKAPEGFRPFFDMASGAVASFGERVKTVSGEADLGNGMTAVPMPGHTPGHMGIMLESDGDQLLIWGDIVHVLPVQFADPSVTIAFDADQFQAAATRARVLDMVATDGLKVAGSHIDFPSLGFVSKVDTGYRWEQAPYPYG